MAAHEGGKGLRESMQGLLSVTEQGKRRSNILTLRN